VFTVGAETKRVIVGKPFRFTSDSDRLYAYFESLDKTGINLEAFESNWAALNDNYFTKNQIIKILKLSADAIEKKLRSFKATAS
jgi:hypothetical protein